MRTVPPERTENPAAFADRFFERQRLEIMARADAEQRHRAERWRVLPLLAASLLATVLVFSVISRKPTPSPVFYASWLSEMSVGQPLHRGDPLAAFGAWGLSEGDATFVLIDGGDEVEIATLLPPLFDSEPPSVDLPEGALPGDNFDLWLEDLPTEATNPGNSRQQG